MNQLSKVGLGVGLVLCATALGVACGGPIIDPSGGSGGAGFGETSSAFVSAAFSSAFATTGAGVFTDPCGKYFVDAQSKSIQCGIASTPGMIPMCQSASEAALDTCLDGCLPLIDCGCIKNPSGTDCNTKLAPYAMCTKTCQVEQTTVSSSVSSASSTGSWGMSSSSSTSTATATSTSTGTGGTCTTGMAGTANDPQCNTCWGCASDSECKPQRTAFMQAPYAGEWLQCAEACPKDDPSTPADEFHDCVAICSTSYPGAESKYLAFLACVACQACSNDCNSAGYYGTCTKVSPF